MHTTKPRKTENMEKNQLTNEVNAQTQIQIGLRDLANVYVQDRLREHKGRLQYLKDHLKNAENERDKISAAYRAHVSEKAESLKTQASHTLEKSLSMLLQHTGLSFTSSISGGIFTPSNSPDKYHGKLLLNWETTHQDVKMTGTLTLVVDEPIDQASVLWLSSLQRAQEAVDEAAKKVITQRDFLLTRSDWQAEAEAQLTKAVAARNGISHQLLADLSAGLKLLGADRLPVIEG